MLMAKAGKLFESELKTDIEEVQIPRNKEYLKDMMAVLIQYQENERRMKACRDQFNNEVIELFLNQRSNRTKQSADNDHVQKPELTETVFQEKQDEGHIECLGQLEIKYEQPVKEMVDELTKCQENHRKVLEKYADHEQAVASVGGNWSAMIKEGIKKACKNDEEFEKLMNSSK